jgi:putative flippase GtrA
MIPALGPRARRWMLFVVGGGLNTAFTWLVYFGLQHVIHYQVAYLCAYVLGIAFSYIFNACFVFHAPLSWRRALAYPGVYLVQYIAAAILLRVLVETLGMRKEFAPLLVAVALIPATYAMSKIALTWKYRRRGDEDKG